MSETILVFAECSEQVVLLGVVLRLAGYSDPAAPLFVEVFDVDFFRFPAPEPTGRDAEFDGDAEIPKESRVVAESRSKKPMSVPPTSRFTSMTARAMRSCSPSVIVLSISSHSADVMSWTSPLSSTYSPVSRATYMKNFDESNVSCLPFRGGHARRNEL